MNLACGLGRGHIIQSLAMVTIDQILEEGRGDSAAYWKSTPGRGSSQCTGSEVGPYVSSKEAPLGWGSEHGESS